MRKALQCILTMTLLLAGCNRGSASSSVSEEIPLESWTWYDFKNVDMALKLPGDMEVMSNDMDRKDMVMTAENDQLYVEFSKWNWVSLPDDEHLAEMVAYVMETDVETLDRNGIAIISSVQEDGAIKYFMISGEGDDYCLDIVPRENVSLDDVKDIVSEIDDSICPNTDVPASVNVIAVEKEDPEIDYLVLVNKLNALPEDWEDNLDVVFATNSFGDEIEVERTACKAYLQLREYLRKHDGIEVELDSARRSVATQQKIMDDFTAEYGADYAAKTVAMPGYSEHHTGLALDLYFRLDGEDVYYNEDMVQHPEIWEKVHAVLADYGFILRYLEGKEHITGYGYEPWHLRYVGEEVAKEIMATPGLTFEVWLGADEDPELTIDYGASTLYTKEELAEAAVQIKCKFASFPGADLLELTYAGDECNSEENIQWMNELDPGNDYVQVAEFLTNFTTREDAEGVLEPNAEYTDYQWWLARSEDGGWQLLSWGY